MTYDKQQIKRELHERNLKANEQFRRTLRAMYRDHKMFTCNSVKEINEKYRVGTMLDFDIVSHGQTKGE